MQLGWVNSFQLGSTWMTFAVAAKQHKSKQPMANFFGFQLRRIGVDQLDLPARNLEVMAAYGHSMMGPTCSMSGRWKHCLSSYLVQSNDLHEN